MNLRGYIERLNNGEQTRQMCYVMLTLLNSLLAMLYVVLCLCPYISCMAKPYGQKYCRPEQHRPLSHNTVLCPEHSPMPQDTICVQKTAHSLTTQTVSKTQPNNSVNKLCPENSPLPHDTNTVQNTVHCLKTKSLSRTQPIASRNKLCPEHRPLPHGTISVQNTAHCLTK